MMMSVTMKVAIAVVALLACAHVAEARTRSSPAQPKVFFFPSHPFSESHQRAEHPKKKKERISLAPPYRHKSSGRRQPSPALDPSGEVQPGVTPLHSRRVVCGVECARGGKSPSRREAPRWFFTCDQRPRLFLCSVFSIHKPHSHPPRGNWTHARRVPPMSKVVHRVITGKLARVVTKRCRSRLSSFLRSPSIGIDIVHPTAPHRTRKGKKKPGDHAPRHSLLSLSGAPRGALSCF